MSGVETECRRLPVGAEIFSGPTERVAHFRVWAPRCKTVALVVTSSRAQGACDQVTEMTAEAHGYFSASVPMPGSRSLYGFRLNGGTDLVPDPASRFQPGGPTGLSQVIDAREFAWSDSHWRGLAAEGQVIYEMHIGTFTPQGTWAAAAEQLPELARAGMTILEIMPVADFPGSFGWGYDGVCHFAPTRLYGRPDDFRHFVDRAHALGLGVILDVVYNHFGPCGNSLPQYSADYTTKRYPNEWGDAVNFDGKASEPVREYFLANVRYWIEEFHLDGFRFDATQSIHDQSDPHILTELVTTARQAAGERSLYIIAENEPQNVRMLRTADQGGHGMNALWNDDFHHAAMVRLTGHNEAYYSDYRGTAEEFAAVIQHGFLYQGQRSLWQGKPRGTPVTGFPAASFVSFLQNHDQVANSGTGSRIDRLTSPGRLRAMTALWLLMPQTPLFFQGQEFAASTPFFYFADNSGDLAEQVADGRAEFLSQFPSLAGEQVRQSLRNPADASTFELCRLDFQERKTHAAIYALHVDLLRLRREDPVFRRQSADQIATAVINPECLLLRYFGADGDDRLLLTNFGRDLAYSPAPQPLLAPPEGREWLALWESTSTQYGGDGSAPLQTDQGWKLPGEATIVLRAIPASQT